MSPVPADTPALRLAVAFVNTYDLLSDPPDYLTVERVCRLARHHGQARLGRELAGADLDELRALRTRLYAVFAADTGARRVAALDRALRAEPVTVGLAHEEGLRLAVRTADPAPARRLAALLLDALAHAMVTGGPDRFGTCAGHPCRCGYLDRTRGGRQRYCCELCNDRMAAAAYRDRRPAHPRRA